MGIVSQTVLIGRPPEAVYNLAWRPERATDWIAGMVATGNVQPGDPVTGLGCRFDWTYRMAGLTYRGQNRIVEAGRPLRLREESSGDLVSTWDWRFEPDEGGTRVHLTVTYTPPLGWLGRLLDPLLLRRLNQRALNDTLSNLKRLLELEIGQD
ncbi:MAG: SRPBCC family protein [Anaerolineae bacterium]|nr:MAG: SRPBCC family protein [Anaerolineae bacterium]